MEDMVPTEIFQTYGVLILYQSHGQKLYNMGTRQVHSLDQDLLEERRSW